MITWAAIRLFFSGAFDALVKGLSAAAKWVFSDWRNGPLLVCALMWMAHALLIVPARNREIAELDASLAAEQAAHLGTVNAFLAASAQAQKDAEANAQRVAREQEIITNAKVAEYRADLGDLRARFDRLRRARDAARTDPGHADPAGLSGLPAAPGRAAGAAPDHDLRPTRERGTGGLGEQLACPAALICLTIDEAEDASEDAHRFNRLIDWVLEQSAVRFTPKETAE
jgi:hypothetical protein